MKAVAHFLITCCLILCITCLVNSDQAIPLTIQILESQTVQLEVQLPEQKYYLSKSQELTIDPTQKPKYRYSTGSEDEIDEKDYQLTIQYAKQKTLYQSHNLRLETKGYYQNHKIHREQFIILQDDDWTDQPQFIILVILFVVAKVALTIFVIWRTCNRARLQKERQQQYPQRYFLDHNPQELRQQIRYHQNQTEHLKKYFLQIETFQKQEYERRQNHQFMGYDHPERYYSESSSARTHRSQSFDRREVIESPEQRLEKYRLVESLCLKNKKAVHLLTNQNVIIKILDKLDGEKVHNYVKILKMLPLSANIVRVLEIIETAEKIYVVMEGGYEQLHNYLQNRRKLTERQAINILKQLIDGVETLSHHNISHSSICSQLVFINSENQVKINPTTNSILMNSSKNLTKPNKQIYYSPESIEYFSNNKQIFYQPLLADIWACGVLFYSMLYNKLPFNGQLSQQNLFFDIQNKSVLIAGNISKGCRMLILGMLAKNPEQRFGIDEIKAWIKFTEDSCSVEEGGEQVDERKKRFGSNIQVFKGEEKSGYVVKRNPSEVFEKILHVLTALNIEFTVLSKYALQTKQQKLRISLQMIEGAEPSFVLVFSQGSRLKQYILKQLQL